MKIIVNIIISICILNSCASIQKDKNAEYQTDIFEYSSNNIEDISEQISLRKLRVLSLNAEINKLRSYNTKISQRVDFEQVYNKDSSTINRYMEENNKIINNHKLLKTKIEKEIRVLERMIEKLNN